MLAEAAEVIEHAIPWTDRATAISGVVSAALIAVALGVAIWQLVHARSVREEQTRPYVILDFEPGVGRWFDLAIRNIGTTVARDVRFSFDPPLVSSFDGDGAGSPVSEWPVLKDGIAWMPPGREIRMFFDTGPARKTGGLRDTYQVHVSYRGMGKSTYEDKQVLDLSWYWGMQQIAVHTVHDIFDEVKAIANSMRTMDRVSREVVPGIGGLSAAIDRIAETSRNCSQEKE